jgi:predicted RNA methylase
MTRTTERIGYTPDPGLSYWPTPADVADGLVMQALCPGYGDGAASHDGEVPQVRILEPSAGEGHLARAVRRHLPRAHITAIEPAPQRAAVLRAGPDLADEVVETTLENYLACVGFAALLGEAKPFELVLMNPPFALDGRPEAWAEHILAIWNAPGLVNPGGTVAAVVPRIVLTGKSKLVRRVRGLLGDTRGRHSDGTLIGEHGRIEPCRTGAFAPVRAGVSTALLWLYKS